MSVARRVVAFVALVVGVVVSGVVSPAEAMVASTEKFSAVAAGESHSCSLLTTGLVFCSGDNVAGQLGDGTTTDSVAPVAVLASPGVALSGVKQLVGGGAHTCALLSNGQARCWGRNTTGELGNGSTTDSSYPVAVLSAPGGPALSGIKQLSAGGTHTCALLTSGQLRCWGFNGFGQLGNGTFTDSSIPVTVVSAVGGAALAGVAQVEVGSGHSCAVLTSGQARCWGYNLFGSLGDGTGNNASVPVRVLVAPGGAALSGVARVAAGDNHSCAVLTSGQARCWGFNAFGQLGDGTNITSSSPVVVRTTAGGAALAGVKQLDAGTWHNCALLSSGQVRCWGENDFAQLGNDTTIDSASPVTVLAAPGVALVGVKQVALGESHSCLLLTNGQARCVGANTEGQLGDTTTTQRATASPGPLVATTITGGLSHSCALVTGGQARCWGYNGLGELGNGTTTNSTTPVTVLTAPGGPALTGIKQLVSGPGSHTCALLNSGQARCWGANSFGQLGNGTPTNSSTPVTVLAAPGGPALGGITQLSLGNAHTCARLTSGQARCWGYNADGELGDGTTTEFTTTPVTVLTAPGGPALGGITQLTAGSLHTCALLTSGQARCWGYNGYGQLGDGTTTGSTTPLPVVTAPGGPALTAIKQLSAGETHTCAWITGGQARCWGRNFYGQLGNGTTTDSTTPVTVLTAPGGPALTGIKQLSAISSHTCALLTSGQARCWGYNAYRQLGNGTITNSSTPVAVLSAPGGPALTGITNIAAGYSHTCVVATTLAACTGANFNGQLGNGTTTDASIPRPVTVP